MNLRKGGKKRRIKLGIRPQLIILVCFSSLFSLLILAIVIGLYVSNIVSGLRSDRLSVISELKSTQIKQSLQFIYYQISWLAQRDTISSPLSYYRAGNSSQSLFSSAQLAIDQFLTSSDVFASARLYSVNLQVILSSTNNNVDLAEPVEDALYSFSNSTGFAETISTKNDSNALPSGYLTGPLANYSDTDSTNSSFFMDITVPVYANSSIIVSEQSIIGYLSVIASASSIQSAIDTSTYEEDYSCVVIEPIYASNDSNSGEITGFSVLFDSVDPDSDFDSYISIDSSEADKTALSSTSGTATHQSSLRGYDVAIGYTRIQIDTVKSWTVIVEQSQSRFYGPVRKLTNIMIGVVIGIGVFVCLITFPLAVFFVIPITKLKNAIESINRSKKEKTGRSRSAQSPGVVASGGGNNDDENKRNSLNSASSGSSTVYSTGIRLPERIPQSKHLFKDEITELSEAFNIMTEELEKQYGHLEDRVRLRTKELEASKIEAEAANEAKTVFIANISHELRTPLNGILGMTSIAMEETDRAQIQDSLKLIHRSGELLLHILTELLTYSKNTLNRSKLEKSNFQILEVVYQVKSIFSKLALDQRVNFSISVKPNSMRKLILLGDSNRIIQIIMNLVSNSLKFTPVDGYVDVTIRLLGEYDHDASKALDYTKVCVKKQTAYNSDRNVAEQEFSSTSQDEFNPTNTKNSKLNNERRTSFNSFRKGSTSLKKSDSTTHANQFNENLDAQSIATMSTTEFEDILFRSQFSETKPLPKLPHRGGSIDQASVPEVNVSTNDPVSSEINNSTNNGSSNSLAQVLPPVKPDLNHKGSDKSEYLEISKSELIKGDKVYKMRNLHVPKSWVIQFEVKDTGSGIEPALQEKVFEPFIQGDQTLSRSYGGTGLGLSICRQLAKMMHGTLTLKSVIGKGSTFLFTLPLPQSGEIIVSPQDMQEFCEDEFNPNSRVNRKVIFDLSEISPNHESCNADIVPPLNGNLSKDSIALKKSNRPTLITMPTQTSSFSFGDSSSGDKCLEDLSHLNILVAEDNSVNQEVIRRMLKLEGFSNITMAVNGADAVDLVKKSYETQSTYDVIFMDVQMPKMDGLTATRLIRKNLRYTKPIIALTAFADESNVKECLNCGMSGFLSKPIKRTNLRKIVQEIIPELLKEIVTTPSTFLEEEKGLGYDSHKDDSPDTKATNSSTET